MAINKPRIAGKPAVERRRVKNHLINVREAPPTDAYIEIDSDGLRVSNEAVTPEVEGQLIAYFFVDSTGLNRRMQLYVAVDIDGTLAWKVVSSPTNLNRWTGKPYDPIFDG